jgi:hypothetical protein
VSARPDDAYAVLVRRALVPTALVGAAATVAGFAAEGPRAGLGALVGTALVCLFFFTTLLLMRLTAPMAPKLTLGVALLAYWVKASVLGMFLLASPLLTWFDPLWFGAVVIAGTVCWMVLHVRGLWTARVLLVEPDPPLGRRAS